MIPFEIDVSISFATHIHKAIPKPVSDRGMVDLIRYPLPVNRIVTNLVAGPVLEQSSTDDKVVRVAEIYKLVLLLISLIVT